jgi:DNA-directed RNA polymerase specialized sigma24 family protein
MVIDGATSEQDRLISEVVAREQGRLRGFIRRRVADRRDAEDILQDVFFELVEAHRLLAPIEQVAAWMFRVARNRWILFGGWRGMGGHRRPRRYGLAEHWERMSPEQREQFRRGLEAR